MQNRNLRHIFLNPEFLVRLFLALAWLAGIILGFYFPFSEPDRIASMMRRLPCEPVSIVGLVACVGIPFTASILCLYFSAPYILIAIAFLKAFSTGLCMAALQLAYGDATWLANWLLCFCDSCFTPLLLWFMYRCVGRDTPKRRVPAVLLVIAIAFVCADYCIVSSFTRSIFHH